jgi:hypothetical protein
MLVEAISTPEMVHKMWSVDLTRRSMLGAVTVARAGTSLAHI